MRYVCLFLALGILGCHGHHRRTPAPHPPAGKAPPAFSAPFSGAVWTDAKIDGGVATPPQSHTTAAGRSVSILLDDAALSLDGQNDPLVSSRLIRVRMQPRVSDECAVAGYKQELRGAIRGSPGASATIIAEYSGRTEVLDFPVLTAQSDPEPDSIPVWGGDIYRETVTPLNRAPRSQAGTLFFELPPYEATLLITARRERADQYVTVRVDSLDVALIEEAEETRKPGSDSHK